MTNKSPMVNPVDDLMKEAGVSRETAIQVILLSMEAALRSDTGDEASIRGKLGELFIKATKARAPWVIEYSASGYRKNLPAWTRLNDEALERGQDPVTVMSMKEKVTMNLAKERIAIVNASKEGKTIEEIVEMVLKMDESKTETELYEEFLENFDGLV